MATVVTPVGTEPAGTQPARTGPARPGGGSGAVDAAAVLGTLRHAYASGRTRSTGWRLEQLRGIEALVTEHEDELLQAMADDFGKPRFEAWMTDLMPVAAEASHAASRLTRWMRPRWKWPGRANLPGRSWTVPEPKGTVLVMAPWNYPVQLALVPLVAAVAAGNSVALKPSELTPATSAALARLVPRHLDAEGVVVVEGAVDVATALLEQPFDHIFFTGSVAVGKVVMAAAARHLASVTLELGGKSPVVVAADADIDTAARRIAFGKLLNAGQTCIAPDYVLVERPVAGRLVDALVTAVADLEGPDPAATRTRIVDDRHLDRLESLLGGSGGRVACGGTVDRSERWLAPTVVVDPDPAAPLMQEEIFGPILPVVTVDSVAEATDFVNRRDKPLALYLFTGSRTTEQEVIATTSSGGVCVNHTVMHFLVPELPFGGVGASGTGSYHGRAGFEELSHRKPVLRRSVRPDLAITYPPVHRDEGADAQAVPLRAFGPTRPEPDHPCRPPVTRSGAGATRTGSGECRVIRSRAPWPNSRGSAVLRRDPTTITSLRYSRACLAMV
jgi:aldehyde dehydrogenase (NAD+)